MRYGSWPSPLTAEHVAAGAVGVDFPSIVGERVYWTERRSLDEGRVSIVCRSVDGTLADVTPAGFNAQTQMLEYGGIPYVAVDSSVYSVRFSDQRIWVLREGGAEPITPDDGARYADLVATADGAQLICVRELRREGRVDHQLVRVPTLGGEPVVLVEGHDFFAAPPALARRPVARLADLGAAADAVGRNAALGGAAVD